jgi:hypothetical protein
MPIGYLAAVTFIAWCTLFAVAPPRPRQSSPSSKSYWFGFLVNELPFVAFYWLLASTLLAFAQGDIRSPGGWVVFGVAVLATVGLVVVARRGLRAGSAVDHALSEGLGAGWRAAIDAGMAARLRRRLPWARILLGPFFFRRRDVERAPTSATATRANATSTSTAIAPIRRAAPRSSTCTGSVPQRQEEPRGAAPPVPPREPGLGVHQRELPPESGRAVSRSPCRRQEGDRLGAGTRPRVRRRPDDGVRGGEFRGRPPGRAGCPHAQRHRVPARVRGCGHLGHRRHLPVRLLRPPRHQRAGSLLTPGVCPNGCAAVLCAHGDKDTVVLVEDARRFVARLRSTSSNPVVYAELPGGQHTFDLFHSLRFERVVDGIEAFAAWVRSREEGQQVRLDGPENAPRRRP